MKVNTVNCRRLLKPRGWPYWQPVGRGKAIGFYRTASGGTWRARLGIPEGKHLLTALGGDLESEYDDMFLRAQEWFGQALTLEDTRYTVEQAVADYVAHLTVEKGEKASKQVKQRLQKHLIPKYGHVELLKLTTRHLKTWRDGLVRVSDNPEDVRKSKDSANRVLSMAKAAFNLAFRSGLVNTDTAWKRVPSFKDVGEARKLFLTDEQVKALLAHARGGLRDLLRAGVLTSARYGELTAARVHDLDVIHGSLRLTGKTDSLRIYQVFDTLV